jgi:HD-like signal output (HDOD) protein
MPIDQASSMTATVHTSQESASQMVDAVKGLVSPPDVCTRVLHLVRSPDATAREIGEVISRDPSLTARLLRIVNSPFYGVRKRVDTVSRAVAIVGGRELYSLVVAVSAAATFMRIPNDLVNMDTFWRHSVFCGLISRNLAKRCRVLHPERLFVAGLLHDIGSLVIYNRQPEKARELLDGAQGDEGRLYGLEMEALGFSHAHLGGLLMASWSLPDALQEAVLWHHQPEHAKESPLEAAIVHVAEKLANRSEIGAFCEAPTESAGISPSVWATLKMPESELDQERLIGEAGIEFADTVSLLAVKR